MCSKLPSAAGRFVVCAVLLAFFHEQVVAAVALYGQGDGAVAMSQCDMPRSEHQSKSPNVLAPAKQSDGSDSCGGGSSNAGGVNLSTLSALTRKSDIDLPSDGPGNPISRLLDARQPHDASNSNAALCDSMYACPCPGLGCIHVFSTDLRCGVGPSDGTGYVGASWSLESQPKIRPLTLHRQRSYNFNGQPTVVNFETPGLALSRGSGRLVTLAQENSYTSFASGSAHTDVVYRGMNGANVVGVKTALSAQMEVVTLTSAGGGQEIFFSDKCWDGSSSTSTCQAAGQLWKKTSPDGKTTFVGDHPDAKTNPTLAVNGYNSYGAVTSMFEEVTEPGGAFTSYTASSVGQSTAPSVKLRKYVYSYVANGKLGEVKVYIEGSPGQFTKEVSRATYEYYPAYTVPQNQPAPRFDGTTNDLKIVRTRRALPESAEALDDTYTLSGGGTAANIFEQRVQYYRYYKDASSQTVSAEQGPAHAVKVTLGNEGSRRAYVDNAGTNAPAFSTAAISSLSAVYDAITDADLKKYSDAYYEYDIDPGSQSNPEKERKIKKAFFNGECGCSGGSSGLYEYRQESNPTASGGLLGQYQAGYWSFRTIVKQPDGNYQTKYFDQLGQALSTIVTNGDPQTGYSKIWATHVVRDANSWIERVHSPDNVSGYNHSDGTFTHSSSQGLVNRYVRYLGGDFRSGLVQYEMYHEGYDDANPPQDWVITSKTDYENREALIVDANLPSVLPRPMVKYRWSYHTLTKLNDSNPDDDTHRDLTEYQYTYWDTDNTSTLYQAVKTVTTIYPAVAVAQNGEGVQSAPGAPDNRPYTVSYVRTDGRTAFMRNRDGTYTSWCYASGGQVTRQVQDADLGASNGWDVGYAPSVFGIANASNTFTNSNDGLSGTPLHLVTIHEFDKAGRLTATQMPSGRVTRTYYSVLADGRLLTLTTPRADSGVCYGPVGYSVSNHAGKAEFACTLGVTQLPSTVSGWVNESSADPLTAISSIAGTNNANITGLRTAVYDSPGVKLKEARTYFDVTSVPGTLGTNYDATWQAYDGMGRVLWTKDTTGTVNKVDYDTLGRVTARWVGTGALDDTASTNLSQVEALEYDGGGSGGNSRLTKRTVYTQTTATGATGNAAGDTAGARVTQYFYDVRGNVLAQLNPLAPHLATRYDVMRRPVASASYSSTVSASTDPLTTTSGRLTLSRTFYDARGQVYETRGQYAVNQSTGAIATSGGDDDPSGYVASKSWFDAAGRLVKQAGATLAKYKYDRLGRVIAQYELATSDDSSYADALSVTGDKVLEERLSYYDRGGMSTTNNPATFTGNMVMGVSISRHHTDTTSTGALSSPSSPANPATSYTFDPANAKGRVQIAAYWYDALDRQVESVTLGTNENDSGVPQAFNRGTAALPARSADVLRTGTMYNHSGTVQQVLAPKTFSKKVSNNPNENQIVPIATKYLYDAANRKVAEIRNYIGDTANYPIISATRENDVYTRYAYTNGLMTSMWVDVKGNDTNGIPPTALTGDNADDQVTRYDYGVTRGGSSTASASLINSNNLLAKAVYPPQASGQAETQRTVTYAYNALGQRRYQKDQNGTELGYSYDLLGREATRSVLTLGSSSVDGTVRLIGTSYSDPRGLVTAVTQYDASSNQLDKVSFTYTSVGLLDRISQEYDLASGVNPVWSVKHEYAKKSGNGTLSGAAVRDAWQRTASSIRNPSDTAQQTVTFNYADGLDPAAGRVSSLNEQTTGRASFTPVSYKYLGASRVIETALPFAAQRLYKPGSGTGGAAPDYVETVGSGSSLQKFSYLDRFDRVGSSRWTSTPGGSGTPLDFYRVDPSYDQDSNITAATDKVIPPWSTNYSMDNLDRLTRAQGQTDEKWQNTDGSGALTITGNWARYTRSGGDLNQIETATFNPVNEYTNRTVTNTDNNATTSLNYANTAKPSYDRNGNLIDDQETLLYTYDAFNRLVKVQHPYSYYSELDQQTHSGVTDIAQYRYNGLGYRIGELSHEWGIAPGLRWRLMVYNERWQQVANVRGTNASYGTPTEDPNNPGTNIVDAAPETTAWELYLHNQAGRDGFGSGSYIDSLVMRDGRNKFVTFDSEDNPIVTYSSVFDTRVFYAQNWRYDVVMLLGEYGKILERVRYDAYGRPTSSGLGDVSDPSGSGGPDGALTSQDVVNFFQAFFAGVPNWKCDITDAGGSGPPDGLISAGDVVAFWGGFFGGNAGPGHLSMRNFYDGIGNNYDNRRGYAGYEFDPVLAYYGKPMYHVRNRVLDARGGRWLQRDPMDYTDEANLYEYVASKPNILSDIYGLCSGVTASKRISIPAPSIPIGILTVGGSIDVSVSTGVKNCPKTCCDTGTKIEDVEITVALDAKMRLYGKTLNLPFVPTEQSDPGSGGNVTWNVLLGVQIDVTAGGGGSVKFATDLCSGRDLEGSFCLTLNGDVTVSGGAYATARIGWFRFDLGAAVYGGGNVNYKACLKCEGRPCSYPPADICVGYKYGVKVGLWHATLDILLGSDSKCWKVPNVLPYVLNL